MDEYIKKLDAFQAKNEFLNPCVVKNTNEETEYARAYNKGWNDCNSEFIDNIERIAPTADVQEVKHGKWELSAKWKDGDISATCSLCGNLFVVDKYYGLGYIRGLFIYCPHCGAKMDGDNGNKGV